MSKILFTLILTAATAAQSFGAVSSPGNVTAPKSERSLCESAIMAVQHWAAQLIEDTSMGKTAAGCTAELNFGVQSFPVMLNECVKTQYASLPLATREDWSKHSWKGLVVPRADDLLGPFSEVVRTETIASAQATCKKKPVK